ncbi:MAG: CvpA family protein [Tannerellaceae bacterium]|jgi:membrane protein required for colicin V production|nr:CvpA family protein [Tannerellaceae bacterium]
MNWLDIMLLCLAGIGFVKGLLDGVIKQVVSLIALAAGIFFCAKIAVWLRGYIISWGFPEQGVTILSYIIGFLLIVGLFLLAGEIMHRIIDATPLSILNHLGGGLFGLLIMLLFLSLLFNLMEIIDSSSILISAESKARSHLYHPIRQIIPTIYPHDLFPF